MYCVHVSYFVKSKFFVLFVGDYICFIIIYDLYWILSNKKDCTAKINMYIERFINTN